MYARDCEHGSRPLKVEVYKMLTWTGLYIYTDDPGKALDLSFVWISNLNK